METVRLVLSIIFIAAGVFSAGASVIGNFRLKFCLNRIHSAGIMDTLALSSIIIGVMLYFGGGLAVLKLLLILCFLWCASPVSSHLIARFIVTVDEKEVSGQVIQNREKEQ